MEPEIQKFMSGSLGGGGVQVQLIKHFFCPQLILQRGCHGVQRENQISVALVIFQGDGGGARPLPPPPLWIRPCLTIYVAVFWLLNVAFNNCLVIIPS